MEQVDRATPRNLPSRGFGLQTGIGTMTDNFLNAILDNLTSDNFKGQIRNRVVDPIILEVNNRAKSYICMGAFMYFILIVLLVIIIVMLSKLLKKTKD